MTEDNKMLYNILDVMAENKPMLCINTIVQFLAEDVLWVRENISTVDKIILKELVAKL